MYYIKITPYHEIMQKVVKTSHDFEPNVTADYQNHKIVIQGNTAGYYGFAIVYEPHIITN